MPKEIDLEEFEELSLEGKAKAWLKDYYEVGNLKHNVSLSIMKEITEYLKEKDYIVLPEGGTPKSGISYSITDKGFEFIKD